MSHSKKLNLWQKLKRLLTEKGTEHQEESVAANQDTSDSEATPEAKDNDLRTRATMAPAISISHQAKSALKLEIEAMDPEEAGDDADDYIDTPAALSFKQMQANSLTGPDAGEAPITARFNDYLSAQHWHFTHHYPKNNDDLETHHLSLRMKNEPINWVCLFRIQERTQLVAVYGILPFSIPDSHRNAAMLLKTQLNYDMILGNIEMDLSDGEIRYKTAIDVEAAGMSDEVISYLIQSVIAMTTVTYELFNDLLDNPNPSEDIDVLLDEIQHQVNDRTYFLPSEQVQ